MEYQDFFKHSKVNIQDQININKFFKFDDFLEKKLNEHLSSFENFIKLTKSRRYYFSYGRYDIKEKLIKQLIKNEQKFKLNILNIK